MEVPVTVFYSSRKIGEIMINQLIRSVAGDSTNAVFDKYVAAAGDTDLNKFLDAAVKVSEFENCIKNHKELQAEYVKVLNRIAPFRWSGLKDENIRQWYEDNVEYDAESLKKMSSILSDLESEQVNDKNMADLMVSVLGSENKTDIMDKLAEVPEDKFDEIEYKKPLKLKGITLYHGTSASHYQQIVKDGFLRSTDYSDYPLEESYNDKRFQNMIIGQTGYVFTSMSMDLPMWIAVRGDRKDSFSDVRDSKWTGYGVIFEINPLNYDVFLYKGDEFLIKGKVDLKDATPHFFKMYRFGLVVESTYEEFVKDGVFDDLCNE